MVQCDPYAIKAIVEDSADKATFRPVLQALDVRNSAKEGTADRYRVLVSDTVHFLRCMAVAKLNALVTDGHLVKGCLVRLLDYRVEARKLLSRVVDRHLAGAADEENPDQNDGPLPLSAFAALDALRHCCGGAKAGALEKLARLARRVHHHDFLLRPSALGLLASLAVRCAPRHGDALALKRAGEGAPPATQNLFDELRRCAQCVLSRLLAWPERMAKGGCDLGPDARPPAPTAGSSPDEMGGALAFYDAIACGEALRALKLLGRLGVVAATSDQADSLPLVALLGNRNGVAEGLAATDDPFLADHAHRVLLLDDMADEPPPAPRRRRRGGRPAVRLLGAAASAPTDPLAAHEVDVDALRLMAPGDFADVGVPRDAGEAILDALRADDAGGAPWAKGWY
ncbi:hypothetical protein JL720_16250 [Aureococcus anophagefferens]|nr:hypothetical protein JL720_16250 [Aureococcus anophagefferens]